MDILGKDVPGKRIMSIKAGGRRQELSWCLMKSKATGAVEAESGGRARRRHDHRGTGAQIVVTPGEMGRLGKE